MTADIIRLGDVVRTTASAWPPRNRRRTDPGGHCDVHSNPTPIVVQRAGGPLYDWAADADHNPDLTPPHGLDRESVDVAGWLRLEIG